MRSRVGTVGAVVSMLVAAALVSGPSAAAAPTPTPTPSVTPATGTPAPTPGSGPDAVDHADDAHAAAALEAASKALQSAESDLALARGALATARAELAAAHAADVRAETDLRASVLAETRATQELADVRARLNAHRQDLGRLARSAYQTNGPFGELALVLASDSPEQMADRLAFMQSIASAGNAVIADLGVARADLESSQARLAAARQRQQALRAAAAAALAATAAKEQVATLAEQQVQVVVAARRAAVAAALKAKKEDEARYRVMVVQSGRLGERIRELSAELARTKHPPQGTGEMVRPGTGALTSPFGPRFHPILHYVKIHTGLDLGVGDGISYAADDGVVIITEYNVAYGNMTVIDHGTVGGLHMATLYAHQAAVAVKPGDRVRKGQPIGAIGSTGYSTGPHLHFEVRVDGKPLDPAPFLEDAPLPTVTPTPTPSRT